MAALCEKLIVIDPSELYRPEDEDQKLFRRYTLDDPDPIQQRVRETYRKMHLNQTVDFVRQKHSLWCKFDKIKLEIRPALEMLNNLVDESDPDVNMPNIIHAFQTAEQIRSDYPHLEWLQLTGLIHDLGKLMAFYGEEQWSVVGDTYPVGCELASSIVYRESSFHGNSDLNNPLYSSKYGIYEPHCGIDQLMMSWGHDEYLYRVLCNHSTCTLPSEALYIIRYHSFYPYHRSNDYQHFTNDKDVQMLPWLRLFNKYDLYTKRDDMPDIEQLWPYYQTLIDKYIPGEISW